MVIVLILLVLLIAVGTKIIQKYIPSKEHQDMTEYYHLQADDDISLVVDHEVLETPGKYIDGEVYVDYETVHDRFNDRFYWDANENVLLYTLPDNLVTVAAGSNTYQVGKENQSADYTIVRNDSNTMYLALDFVEQYTNITHEVYEGPNRTVINTVWGDVDTAPAKKATQLRLKGGIKSPIVKDLEKGETLTILDAGDRWTKAMTEDGVIGYLKNKFVGKVTTETLNNDFTEPEFTHISKDFTIEMAWHQVTTKDANATFDKVADTAQGMNVIVPTWFNITDNEGNYTSLASKDYVDKAHALGIQVWAMFDNISTEESVKNVDSGKLFSSTATRKKLIENLMKEADTYGFDGFNLDFESLKSSAGPHYVQFIREMSVSCRQKGLVLSVDDYVPAVYSAFYNRKEQGIVADYVIVMGYDEHFAGGDAGSVASISYVENGITGTLKEVPKEKLINSVPFYTRVWTEKDGKTTSKAYGMTAAKKWVDENNVELTWQDKVGQYYGEIENENGVQKIWMEEAKSLGLKKDLVNQYDLAGIACWKLGFETADIWTIMDEVK